MRNLVFGFAGEGVRDYGFLIPLIERVILQLVPQVEILAFDVKSSEPASGQPEKMRRIFQEAEGYEFLVFHLDADAPTTQRAYEERFEPGYTAYLNAGGRLSVVPVIPVRMTDAWFLVDFDAFQATVGGRITAEEVGFPSQPKLVEAIADPKGTFENALKLARPNKRRAIRPDEVYRPLAERIQLDLLARVPAYQEFHTRLIRILTELHFL